MKRPTSHEPNQIQRLTQLSSTDFIWSGRGVFTLGQSLITTEDRLWVKRRSSHGSNKTHYQRSNKGAIMTLPKKKELTNQTAFVICLCNSSVRLNNVRGLTQIRRSFNYSSPPKLSLGSAHVKYSA